MQSERGKVRPPVRTEEERNKIVVENMRLVEWAVSRVAKLRGGWWGGDSADDARSDALVGLLRAAELWGPGKAKLSTYAWAYMRKRIGQGLREAGLVVNGANGERLRRAPVEEGRIGGNVPPDARAEQDEQRARLALAVERLPARMRDVIKGRLAGLKQREIADRLGVCPSRVGQIEEEARERLRRMVASPPVDAEGRKERW